MRQRIVQFLEKEQLNAAKFADEIGVQRSAVSHILSGRNNPGFEFIQKILTRYKTVNAEWLIMGTGEMYKPVLLTAKQLDLFSQAVPELNISQLPLPETEKNEAKTETIADNSSISPEKTDIFGVKPAPAPSQKFVEKIVMFYSDKTFAVYTPEN